MFPSSLKSWWATLDADLRVFSLAYLVALPFYLAPVLVTRFLPGLDLPFHLAMADMLMKAGDPGSPYAPYYAPRLGLAPYVIHYMGLIALGQIFELATAHSIIVVGYIASLPLAMARLLSVCGRSRLPALLAFPLAYNLCLNYGFVSFCLSLPVLLLLLAGLGRYLGGRDRDPRTLVGVAVAAIALFLSHLQNFLFGVAGSLAVIIFCRASLRRRLWAVAGLAPALLLMLRWKWQSHYDVDPAARNDNLAFAWETVKAARLADLGGRALGDDLRERLRHLPEMALRGFHDGSDAVAVRGLILLVAGYALLGAVAALLPARAQPPARLRVACWILFLGACLAFLALPHHLRAFELMTFFPRFAVLVFLFLLPLVPSALRRIDGPTRYALPLPALLFAVLHGSTLLRHFRAYRAEIADFIAVLSKTPRGGKAVGLVFNRKSQVVNTESPFVGLVGFYVATRPAPGSMVPIHYCGMRHMPCALAPGAPPVPYPGPWLDRPYDFARMTQEFDYVFVRSPPAEIYPQLGAAGFSVLALRHAWAVLHKPRPAEPAPPPAVDAGAPDARPDP